MDSPTGSSSAIVPRPELPDFGIRPEVFDIAARDAGFTTINAKSLGSSAIVGSAIKQLGAVKIGRSKLLLADEQIDQTWHFCKYLIDPDGPMAMVIETMEPKDKIAILNTMAKLAHARGRNAQRLIESAEIDMSDGSRPQGIAASFLPGQKAVPSTAVQININPHKP